MFLVSSCSSLCPFHLSQVKCYVENEDVVGAAATGDTEHSQFSLNFFPHMLESSPMRYITVTSWWARWSLKLPASRLFTRPFVQAQIKEKHQSSTPLAFVREFTGNRWNPRTKASIAENWRHHDIGYLFFIFDLRMPLSCLLKCRAILVFVIEGVAIVTIACVQTWVDVSIVQ